MKIDEQPIMDTVIRNKLAAVLDRVKDPENGMPVSEMGLVAGIKYKDAAHLFEIYFYPAEGAKACCVLLQMNAYSTMEKLIKEEMEKEFPYDKVIFKTA